MSIEITNLTKTYDGKTVLKDFSASIPERSVTVIMGPSGCGKTTLLRILLGFVSPDSGRVTGLPEKRGAVFQEDRLCQDFSALSNVTLVMQEKNIPLAKSLLKELGLGADMDKPVRTLSGGMQRRVAIARALAFDAPLLILDEAFKGLDETTRAGVMETVLRHSSGKTLIAVTHDPEEARFFRGNLIKMEAPI